MVLPRDRRAVIFQPHRIRSYLVTKLYNEVFTQYAVLRPAEVNAPDAPTVRVKIAKTAAGAALPGFTFTQDGSF